MSGTTDARLADLGLTIPDAPQAAGAYVGYVRSGNTLYIAGQIPLSEGQVAYAGKVGVDLSLEDAQAAARLCALNILAQAKAALDGDLDRVRRVVKLSGFVNCPPDFTQHPQVINGASNLMAEVFGERGAHARIALGAGSLPLNVAVEVDAILEVV